MFLIYKEKNAGFQPLKYLLEVIKYVLMEYRLQLEHPFLVLVLAN